MEYRSLIEFKQFKDIYFEAKFINRFDIYKFIGVTDKFEIKE